MFDVTMGSWDGAETCELVGLYLLYLLQGLGLNLGLYRDDGLGVTSLSAYQTENLKKRICKVFSDQGLKVTIEANSRVVDFLDVTLALDSGIFKPYMKPDSDLNYVHMQSNHPPLILKNIPLGINKRLSTISANEEVFNAALPPYQEALKKSGYTHDLTWDPTPSTSGRKNRSRNITWYNPPYSKT